MKGKLDVEHETWIRLKDTLLTRVRSQRLIGHTITDARISDTGDTLILCFGNDDSFFAMTADENSLLCASELQEQMHELVEMGIADVEKYREIKANMERCAKKHEDMDEREEYLRLKKIYESDDGKDPPVGLPPGTTFGDVLGP